MRVMYQFSSVGKNWLKTMIYWFVNNKPYEKFSCYKSLIPGPSQMNPVHTLPSYKIILILSSHIRVGLPSAPFHSRYSYLNFVCTFLSSELHAVPIASVFDHAMCGEEYELWSSLLCSFRQPPVTSSLLSRNILSTLFSKTLSLCPSSNVRHQVFIPIRY
jgi:hypothetical protein